MKINQDLICWPYRPALPWSVLVHQYTRVIQPDAHTGQPKYDRGGAAFMNPHVRVPDALPSLPTSCRWEVIPHPQPVQTPNKSCLINVGFKVLIHQFNIVAIQSSGKIRTCNNEISLHLLITPSSQPETKKIRTAGNAH